MKISGSNLVPFPVGTVWDAILDPRVLVATIPGCEQLAATGDNAYDMTVTAGVAAIKGTYQGSCTLSDLKDNESLVMRLSGAGAPGTIDATVKVFFGEAEPGVTKIDYEADAIVGGMVGGVGQRMLTSVSKRMAGEFFGNVASAIASPVAEQGAASPSSDVETPAGQAAPATVFSAPAKSSALSSQDDFLKGIVVGAGLVVLGVVVGGLFGRRQR
jgi:carbon monoxide dehydrogenase subunit G